MQIYKNRVLMQTGIGQTRLLASRVLLLMLYINNYSYQRSSKAEILILSLLLPYVMHKGSTIFVKNTSLNKSYKQKIKERNE